MSTIFFFYVLLVTSVGYAGMMFLLKWVYSLSPVWEALTLIFLFWTIWQWLTDAMGFLIVSVALKMESSDKIDGFIMKMFACFMGIGIMITPWVGALSYLIKLNLLEQIITTIMGISVWYQCHKLGQLLSHKTLLKQL